MPTINPASSSERVRRDLAQNRRRSIDPPFPPRGVAHPRYRSRTRIPIEVRPQVRLAGQLQGIATIPGELQPARELRTKLNTVRASFIKDLGRAPPSAARSTPPKRCNGRQVHSKYGDRELKNSAAARTKKNDRRKEDRLRALLLAGARATMNGVGFNAAR